MRPTDRGRNAAHWWAEWLTKHPLLTIAAAVLLTAGLISGVRFLGFNTDYKVFFDQDNPDLVAFERMSAVFSRDDTILFVVHPRTGDIFTPETLSAVEQLTNEAWHIPHAVRVDSPTNFQHTAASEDELVIDDLVQNAASLSPDAIAELRTFTLAEPELVRKLVAADGQAAGVLVTLHLPEGSPAATMTAVAAARRLADATREANPTLDVAMTGLAPIAAAYPEASQRDISTLLPAMLGVVLLVLLTQLRSLIPSLLAMAVILASSAAAFGFAGWTGILLTPPSMMAPLIIITIGVADCLHLIMAVQKARAAGETGQAAVRTAVRATAKPLVITSVTTAMGFLALNFASSPPYREMGNMAATGTVVALLLSLSVLPVALMVPFVCGRHAGGRRSAALGRLADRIASAPRRVVVLGLALSACILPFGLLLTIDDHIVEYFDESMQIRQDSEFALEHLTGIYNVAFSVATGRDYGIADPEYLERLEAFTSWLRDQPEVRSVSSFSDTVKSMNRSMHADDPAWYRLPETPEMASQYTLLYEYSLPYGRTLMDRVDLRKSTTRVMVTLGAVSTAEILDFKARGEDWLRAHGTWGKPHATGVAVMFAGLTHQNIETMLWGTAFMLIAVVLAVGLTLRSWRLGLISIAPNILPPVLAFCLWAAGGGLVNTAVSMVTVVALGLIVDATIHLLVHYQNGLRQGQTPEDAVRASLEKVGAPIIASTVTLAAGFLILSQSSYRMNAEMGLLSALMVIVAMVFDLVVLPALLLMLDRRRTPQSEDAAAPVDAIDGLRSDSLG